MTFASLYQAHHDRYTDDLPFWLSLADQHPGPVLELGCGTGRVLIPLAQAGSRVIGLDHDAGMLSLLQYNLRQRSLSDVSLIQADFTAFHMALRFSLVLLTCNTFSTLSTSQRSQLLGRVYKHLQPQGCFAVSQPNPQLLKRLPKYSEAQLEEIFPHPSDSEPVQVSSEWRRERTSFSLHWHYDHLLPQGEVERTSIQITHHLTPVEVLRQEFDAAGFHNLQLLGDFDGSVLAEDSPQLIILAAP